MKKDYEKLIRDIGFRENKIFKKDFISGVVLIVGTINDQSVMLKAFLSTDERRRRGMKKEILVDRIIEKENSKNAEQFRKTTIIKSGETSNIIWMIRKFLFGDSLAVVPALKKDKITPDKLSHIREKYLNRKDKIILSIVEQIKILQTFQNREIYNLEQGYQTSLEKYNLPRISHSLNIDLKNQCRFYDDNYDQYLSENQRTGVIGDLTPVNVLVTDDEGAVLSDLEWFCADNKTLDIAMLWLFLWRYHEWQNSILESLIIDKTDRLNFQSSVIRILIANYNNIFGKDRNDLGEIDIIRKLYKQHIWTKYLIAVGESYDKLINVRN